MRPPGDVFGFLGANGAGKTTTVERPGDALPFFVRAHALAPDPFDRRRLARTVAALRLRTEKARPHG